MSQNVLVVIEGVDLAGKDTLAQRLARGVLAWLPARPGGTATPALVLREPPPDGIQDGPIPTVRDLLREKTRGGTTANWPPEAWICAFVGAMLSQDRLAREALAAGRNVVYVRREISTIAYQCLLNDRPDLVSFVCAAASALAPADVLIHLDGDPEVLAGRVVGAGPRDNAAFEDIETQRRLRGAYVEAVEVWAAALELSRGALIATVNAEQDLDEVVRAAEEVVRARRG